MGGSGSHGVEQGVRHVAAVASSSTFAQLVETWPAHVCGATTAAGGTAGKDRQTNPFSEFL